MHWQKKRAAASGNIKVNWRPHLPLRPSGQLRPQHSFPSYYATFDHLEHERYLGATFTPHAAKTSTFPCASAQGRTGITPDWHNEAVGADLLSPDTVACRDPAPSQTSHEANGPSMRSKPVRPRSDAPPMFPMQPLKSSLTSSQWRPVATSHVRCDHGRKSASGGGWQHETDRRRDYMNHVFLRSFRSCLARRTAAPRPH